MVERFRRWGGRRALMAVISRAPKKKEHRAIAFASTGTAAPGLVSGGTGTSLYSGCGKLGRGGSRAISRWRSRTGCTAGTATPRASSATASRNCRSP